MFVFTFGLNFLFASFISSLLWSSVGQVSRVPTLAERLGACSCGCASGREGATGDAGGGTRLLQLLFRHFAWSRSFKSRLGSTCGTLRLHLYFQTFKSKVMVVVFVSTRI